MDDSAAPKEAASAVEVEVDNNYAELANENARLRKDLEHARLAHEAELGLWRNKSDKQRDDKMSFADAVLDSQRSRSTFG